MGRRRLGDVQDHFFKEWSSDMAYILGFLYADGNVRPRNHKKAMQARTCLTIARRDVSVMEFILSRLAPSRKIYPAGRDGMQVEIPSEVMVEDLRKLGMGFGKEHRRLTGVPDGLRGHLLRGLFDGDGCLCVLERRSIFSINHASGIFLGEVRESLGGLRGVVYPLKNHSRWQLGARSDIEALEDIMYARGGFCLERKRNKFLQARRLAA